MNDVVCKFMQFDFGNAMYTGGPVEALWWSYHTHLLGAIYANFKNRLRMATNLGWVVLPFDHLKVLNLRKALAFIDIPCNLKCLYYMERNRHSFNCMFFSIFIIILVQNIRPFDKNKQM